MSELAGLQALLSGCRVIMGASRNRALNSAREKTRTVIGSSAIVVANPHPRLVACEQGKLAERVTWCLARHLVWHRIAAMAPPARVVSSGRRLS
jgi:hypothetical protein